MSNGSSDLFYLYALGITDAFVCGYHSLFKALDIAVLVNRVHEINHNVYVTSMRSIMLFANQIATYMALILESSRSIKDIYFIHVFFTTFRNFLMYLIIPQSLTGLGFKGT